MKNLVLSILILGGCVGVSHATWQEFYMVTTGSDTNAGSTTNDTADVYSFNGNWGGSILGRFTAASGTPFSGVSPGQMASVFIDNAAGAVFISSVIAVNGGGSSIDIDTTTKWGVSPATSTTARSCKIGGAWASLGVVTTLFAANTAPLSTRVNIKAGTYANTTTNRTFGMAGTTTAPIWWRGYKINPGDEDINNVPVAGTDIPSWTFTTGQVADTAAWQIFSSININSACTSANGAFNPTSGSSPSLFYRILVTNTAANANGRAATFNGNANVVASYFKATTTADRAVSTGAGLRFHGNYINGGTIGLFVGGTNEIIGFNVIDSPAGDAIQVGGNLPVVIYNNSIYNPTGNGVNFNGALSTAGNLIINNYFENVNQAGKAAINNTSGTNTNAVGIVSNAYYNCTSNVSGFTESLTVFDNGTLSSAAFTAPASQNFSILPIGKALSYPGTFENTSVYQGYLDIGAVQRQEKGFQGVFAQ